MNADPHREEQLVLELLDVVGRQNDVSQRHLARHMGVALGLANSYLKRCIRKGLIKITAAPANRYLYYLTPKGFSEKSRLTAKYLSYSFEFYRKASESCLQALAQCEARGWKQVALGGLSDLAEITSLRSIESSIEVIGSYDPASDRKSFLNRPVWGELGDVPASDGWIVTSLTASQAVYGELVKIAGRDRVVVPDILRLG